MRFLLALTLVAAFAATGPTSFAASSNDSSQPVTTQRGFQVGGAKGHTVTSQGGFQVGGAKGQPVTSQRGFQVGGAKGQPSNYKKNQ